MSCLIKLENVSKTYHVGDALVPALHAVNLEIARGEMLAIQGASGSGKSTLMNIIGCLDICTTGHYYFAGQEVSGLSEDELANMRNTRIGFVFQAFFLLPRATALQNVMLPLSYRNVLPEEAVERAMTMLDKVGMSHLAHHKPQQLSGGQQQRVAIARALVGQPDVILADEPTGALDSKTGSDVMDLLTELHRKESRTLAIITHDQAVSKRCERVVMIKDGKLM